MKLTSISLAASLAVSLAVAGGEITPVQETVPKAETKVDYGTVFGQSRTFYIDRTYKGSIENNRNSLATGGYVGYKTPDFDGLSATVALYGVYGFDIHDKDAKVAGSSSYDPSLYGDGFKNYLFLGEAYLSYSYENTTFKVGRQRLDTPLAGADDARMLPNLFEAAVLSNTDIKDTTLILAHVTKESVGTFGNVYTPGALSLQSGYGLGFKEATSGKFRDMGVVALGKGTNTDGVTAVAAIYSGIPGLKLQAWDYYAHDILNALYLQADYSWDCLIVDGAKMSASAQYINQTEVGDKLAGDVDSNYWGLKLAAKYGNFNIYGAYSQTDSSVGSAMNGGVITPWGGMPAFTQGMVTRHQFFADTDAWKVGASYNLKDYGVPLVAAVYHAQYDIGKANTYKENVAWKAKESGVDLTYKPSFVDNVEMRLRANFPTDFAPGLDWDEYRFIINYNF